MRKLLLLTLLLLIVFVPALADDDDYRLREPDAEEYINRVESVRQIANTFYSVSIRVTLQAEVTAMMDEINWRYLDQDRITSHQLITLYGLIPDTVWLRPMINLYIEENSIDLAEVTQMTIDNFTIEVDPLTGGMGYLLRVLGEPYYASERPLLGSLVAIPDASGSFVLPQLPFTIDGGVIASGDLDADGHMEIAYLHTVDHAMNTYFDGDLIVVRLVEDAFETVTSLRYSHGPQGDYVRHWFINMDSDRDLELVWTQRLSAVGWNCDFIETSLYDWNSDGQLTHEHSADNYPATFGCLFLQAEQAMWLHDYSRAVTLYERAFEETVNTAFLPYAQIRMAFAYLLTDQTEAAEALFTQISQSESDLAQVITEAYTHNPEILPMCQAFYRYAFEGEDNLAGYGAFDRYTGGFNRFNAGMNSFDIDNATCDIAYHLDRALSEMRFPVGESPLTQLENLGLELAGHIEDDLDMDGVNEWLIWMNAQGIDPLFFHAVGDHYTLTRPRGYSEGYWYPDDDLRQPTTYNSYEIMALPNASERLIANIDFDQDQRSAINCGGACGGGGNSSCTYGERHSRPRFPGDLTLWRLNEGALENVLLAPLCEAPELDNVQEIHAGGYQQSSENIDTTNVIPTIYTWDEATQTIILAQEPEITPTTDPISPVPIVQFGPVYTLNSFNILRSAFIERDFALVVEIADEALASTADDNQQAYAFRYYRALALESLNRPDEALAEYVAIYEAAPESAWGMLAALHFERVE